MPLTVMTAKMADQLRKAELTYSEAGSTAGVLPPGYHHLRRSAVIGAGSQKFTNAAAALFSWQAHLRAGLRGSASSPIAGPGTVVLLALGTGRVRISAPCRIVYVTDEPGRRGFAYGTLPGHPERGEEAFIIQQHDDGTVTFTITAFSTPATPLAKAAGPAGQAIQRHLTTRYLRALADRSPANPIPSRHRRPLRVALVADDSASSDSRAGVPLHLGQPQLGQLPALGSIRAPLWRVPSPPPHRKLIRTVLEEQGGTRPSPTPGATWLLTST